MTNVTVGVDIKEEVNDLGVNGKGVGLSPRKAVGRSALFLLILMVATNFVGFICVGLLHGKNVGPDEYTKLTTALTIVVEVVVVAIVCWYCRWRACGKRREGGNLSAHPTHHDAMTIGRLLMLFAMLAAVMMLETASGELVQFGVHAAGSSAANPISSVSDLAQNTWYIWLFMCVVGPVCEELLFRGAILRTLRQYGEVFAVVTSSVLFALFHGNAFQLQVVLLGLLLGYVTCRYSIKYAIGLHVVNNVLASMLSDIPDLALWVVGGVCLVAALIAYYAYRGVQKSQWIPNAPHVYRAWLSPLFLILVVLMIVEIVLQLVM